MKLSGERVVTAAVGILLGAASVTLIATVISPASVPVLGALATSVAAIVALLVGFVPWLISKSDQHGRAVVMANILGDDLVKYRNAMHHVAGALGIAAETNDHDTIKAAADVCKMQPPTTFLKYLKDVHCFESDAPKVAMALKSLIDVQRSVELVAAMPIDDLTANSGHEAYQKIARITVARAISAEKQAEEAIKIVSKFDAIFQQRSDQTPTESPVPEFAEMVRKNGGPLDPSRVQLQPPMFNT